MNGLKINEQKKIPLSATYVWAKTKVLRKILMKITSNTKFEKLLAVPFDNRLNFNHHISNICKTASNKLHALARVSYYMGQDKRGILFNSI